MIAGAGAAIAGKTQCTQWAGLPLAVRFIGGPDHGRGGGYVADG